MKHSPTSVRFDEPTRKQLEALAAQRGTNRNEVIKTAIDRMYREEMRNMEPQAIINRLTNAERGSDEYDRLCSELAAALLPKLRHADHQAVYEWLHDGDTWTGTERVASLCTEWNRTADEAEYERTHQA